jgi:hypothetical protein
LVQLAATASKGFKPTKELGHLILVCNPRAAGSPCESTPTTSSTTTSTTSTTTTTHGPFGQPTTTTPVATTTSTTTAATNGCTAANTEQHLEDPVIVTFANGQFAPACLAVTGATQFIISGDLSSCGLVGGEVANGPDRQSPFSRPGIPVVGMPGAACWHMPDYAATLPFYCSSMPGSAAQGAVFVTP